jgi:hypothetical protein
MPKEFLRLSSFAGRKESSTIILGLRKTFSITSPDVSTHLRLELKSPWGWIFAGTPLSAISMQLMQSKIQL